MFTFLNRYICTYHMRFICYVIDSLPHFLMLRQEVDHEAVCRTTESRLSQNTNENESEI